MKIRSFENQDSEAVARLFYETIRETNIRDYSSAQVQAWAPNDVLLKDWAERSTSRLIYVADDDGVIAGFGELKPSGYIDCFYCHKNYQRCGVGRQIYEVIEAKALNLGLNHLTVEASITAKPFFQRMGFSVVKEQNVSCRGELLINYLMEKTLQ